MPTITFSLKDLQKLVGREISIERVQEFAHYGKGDFESYDEDTDEVKIDFGDTNVPYLWSAEGFARLIRGILELQKGIPEIKLKNEAYEVIVDKSVAKSRPFIACFAARGKEIDDYLLKQLVQLQEKFCETYGRRRQKVSIGLYSYKRLAFPVHYKAVDPLSAEFAPLDFKSKMNLRQILEEHPKGKEYSWILENFEKYPVLMDNKNEIMSLVPVINSNFTGKLEIGDEDIFFEATGTDNEAVNLAANIFAYALYDRGFDIYPAEIKTSKKSMTPSLATETIKIKGEQIENIFGLKLKEAEIKSLLERAQYNFKDYKVGIAPYRRDILHPYDIIEDIGIMYGYDNISELPLKTFTSGSALKINSFIDKVREIVIGIGFQEVMSPILTNKSSLYRKMNVLDFGTIEIDEYMSETFSVVRSWIAPDLMDVLSSNKHVEFPQKIFEEGLVNVRKEDKIFEYSRIAIASSHENANYTEMRQVLEYVLKYFGLQCDFEEADHSSFIGGRCARAIVKGRKIAYLGEIHPVVLSNWSLEMPVAAMEINLTELFELIEKKK